MTATVKLSQLRPGHTYPGASVNARSTDREGGLDALIASIKADGLLQSLLVCPAPEGPGYFVIAGNRRLSALKKIGGDPEVPVIIRKDATPGTALAMSLAENITQVPLHPVDRYEAFAGMAAGGKSEADIAANYAVTPRTVKQSLALGRLSPIIRDAWRNQKIRADDAHAFTLGKDHAQQEAVFKKLSKGGGLHAHNIRAHLIGDRGDATRFLKFVGRAEYEKAGGALQDDLFKEGKDDAVIVSDLPLLIRLAGERIEAKCKELVAAGWAWAEDADDLPNGYRWDWKHVDGGFSASKQAKASAGCAITVDQAGKIQIDYGLIKPGTKVARDKAAAAEQAKPKAPMVLSNSLRQDLDAMAARAIKDALLTDTYGDDLLGVLARIVAAQITPDRYNYMPREVREKFTAIRNDVAPKVMAAALQKRFDTKRYFSSAPKNLVLKAVAEAVGADHAKKLTSGTKAAAWKFALANVPKTGWLPAELRTVHYDGPGAKKAAAKAKPAKRKAA